MPRRARLFEYEVAGERRVLGDGDHVQVGQQLTLGTIDPQDVLRVQGVRKV